jgi:hypothetical protein
MVTQVTRESLGRPGWCRSGDPTARSPPTRPAHCHVDLLVLEFSAPAAAELYNQVNKLIGLDPSTGSGDWPTGLLGHQAGADGDTVVVVETSESRAAQEEFMRARLEPAFAQADVPPPARVTWLPLVGSRQRR